MTGAIVKRVRHVCLEGLPRWIQTRKGAAEPPPCPVCGAVGTKPIRYDCLWRLGKKQKSRTFQDKHTAARFLTSVVKDVHEGTFVRIRPTPMGEVFDKWVEHTEVRLKQGTLKPSTVKSYLSMLRVHLRPAFADYRSDRLTADAVCEWERTCADEIAAGRLGKKSYNEQVALLQVILKWARKRGQRYLSHDPMVDIARLRVPRVERRFLEPEQIRALLEAAESPNDTILTLAVYSGLRRGELFGLKWHDIDEAAGLVRVRRSNYQGTLTTPKTATSERCVDLPAVVLNMLTDYREAHPPTAPDDFVFRNAAGGAIDPDNWFGRHFVPTAVRAGLRLAGGGTADDEQLVGLHTLRHTYASLLINQGESIKYVSKQLGHASSSITADLYGHLFKETSVSAMNRLEMKLKGTRGTGSSLTAKSA